MKPIRRPFTRLVQRAPSAVILLCVLVVAAGSGEALAATSGKIGFVDMKRLERESTLGKEAVGLLQAEQAQEREAQKALDGEADALRREKGKLTPAERKKRQEELEQKVQAIEQRKAEKPKKGHARQEQLSREFRQKVHGVVRAYAKQEGFIAIFLKGRGLIYGDDEIDISGAIVERLNQQTAKGAESEPAPKP